MMGALSVVAGQSQMDVATALAPSPGSGFRPRHPLPAGERRSPAGPLHPLLPGGEKVAEQSEAG